MKIEKYPLTDSYNIIVFKGDAGENYSISNGHVTYQNAKYIQNDFSNARVLWDNCQMFGQVTKQPSEKFDRMYDEAGLNPKEFNNGETAKESLCIFLEAQGWEIDDRLWVICTKFNKNLTGKKIPMEFNIGAPNFEYGENDEIKLLDVFMSPLTQTTKSLKFSVKIPNHIYQKCLNDPQENLRPTKNYVESESVSYLHARITELYGQAFNLHQRAKEEARAKKVICVNFSSGESVQRDDLNFAYVGNKITIGFNYYICYSVIDGIKGNRFYTHLRVDSGMGIGTTGQKGIVDYTKSGRKNWINKRPSVVIEWSQEREDYLAKLEGNFVNLSKNLNDFLSDLNEDKLQKLISNNELLRLK